MLYSLTSRLDENLPLFGGCDILAMYALSALPFALLLAQSLRIRGARTHQITRFVFIWGCLLGLSSAAVFAAAWSPQFWSLHIARSLATLVILLGSINVICLLVCARLPLLGGFKLNLQTWATAGLVVAVLPAIYVSARCHHDLRDVVDLIDQSRFGEARVKSRRLVRVMPLIQWHDRSLPAICQQLARQVHQLEKAIAATPLDADSPELRLQRCQRLAMLGQTDRALTLLTPLFDSPLSGPAYQLAGVMHEAASQWQIARRDHECAQAAWHNQQASPTRTAALVESLTRLGYCDRKLGNYAQAEAEYAQALELRPDAEMHFLIGQFYEDLQQSSRAYTHIRQAMQLNPQRYAEPGNTLIEKLSVSHFGCLQVFQHELAHP